MYKIWRYYKAPYDHTPDMICSETIETTWADTLYTDEILAQVADNGFNGIWLDAHLYDLVRHEVFPEFGTYAEKHIECLKRLIAKAAKYNVRVYLCMQPGRGVSENDTAFWAKHSHLAGSRYTMHTKTWGAKGDKEYTDLVGLCTAQPEMKRYLEEAFAALGAALPGLGGCILLTGSEFQAHCMTFPSTEAKICPTCMERGEAEVISEVVNLAVKGLSSTNKEARIIAWDWGWRSSGYSGIIEKLDPRAILMPNFESGTVKTICGKSGQVVDEYSLSCPGPSPRFQEEMRLAEKKNMRFMARLQIGTTHELGTVSNLPLLANLFRKACFIKQNHSAGFMGCWNFGNMFSGNTAAFNYFLTDECPEDCHEALKSFAGRYFEKVDCEKAARAWELFSRIMEENYPFNNSFMYAGPVNWALGYFSPPGAMQGKGGLSFSCRLGNDRGDDFSGAFKRFTLEEILPYMGKVAAGAEQALALFEEALQGDRSLHGREELCAFHTTAGCYRSAVNLMKIVSLKMKNSVAEGEEYLAIQKAELENVKKVLPYVEEDPRQGFHAEARNYFFNAERLKDKIRKLEHLFLSK